MPKSKLFRLSLIMIVVVLLLLCWAVYFTWIDSTTNAKMHQQEADTARYSVITVHTENNTIKLLEDKQNGKVYQYTIPNNRLEQK